MKHLTRSLLFVLVTVLSLPFAASVAWRKTRTASRSGPPEWFSPGMLKEDGKVSLSLPDSYAQNSGYRRYPVLYVRDGGKFFHSFTGVVQHLTSDATPHAPEMIVVGIVEPDRVRDSSLDALVARLHRENGRGLQEQWRWRNFRRFLEQELVPYIDKEFSTSGYRIYCGYSFTGLSVIDEFLDADTIFDAFLMIDPSWWWDDYVMEKRAGVTLTGPQVQPRSAVHGCDGRVVPGGVLHQGEGHQLVGDICGGRILPGSSGNSSATRTNRTTPWRCAPCTMASLISFAATNPRCTSCTTTRETQSRYETLSARLGERFSLREDLLTFFGEQFLRNFKEPDQAIRYFEMAADAYPESSGGLGRLG